MIIQGASGIVTGAASGLGRATAHRLVDLGARPVLVDLPGPGLDQVAAELGDSASAVAADVTDDEQVAAAVAHAAELGDLRVVVNCAGIVTPGKVLGRKGPLPSATFAKVLTVNLVGTFNVLRLAAERMAVTDPVDGERGVIVNTASIAAFDGQVGQAAYAASKGGVAAMTLPLARELSEHLIRVVSIAPGAFETPMMASLPDETRQVLADHVPHPKRFGKPGEYAALVAHIIENPMLNGEVIRLDGAVRMPPR